MSPRSMTTWLVGLALVLAPAARAQWDRLPAVAVQDELPDGELDLPDGDEDDPAVTPDPKPKPKPEPKPEPKPKPKPEPKPEPKPDRTPVTPPGPDEDLTPPPDDRGDAGSAHTPVIEPDGAAATDPDKPWIDEDLQAEQGSGRRPVDDDVHEVQVGGEGGRVGQVDEDSSVFESPWFWGGVAGGAALLVGGGVGAGVLIYTLLNSDKGTVVITLE